MHARREQHGRTNRCRRRLKVFLSVVFSFAISFSTHSALAGQHGSHPAPHMQAPHASPSQPRQEFHSQPFRQPNNIPGPQRFNTVPQNRTGQPGHLPDWLSRHQNMTQQQRENALRQEPGFNRLPQDQQQRLMNRMHELNNAPPQERQRMLQRNEMFERLNPEQKAGVRGASQAFRQMPANRQNEVRRAFQDLRGVPPEQRQSILNSARFQQQFSPQERTILGNMLSVEPYEPRSPR